MKDKIKILLAMAEEDFCPVAYSKISKDLYQPNDDVKNCEFLVCKPHYLKGSHCQLLGGRAKCFSKDSRYFRERGTIREKAKKVIRELLG